MLLGTAYRERLEMLQAQPHRLVASGAIRVKSTDYHRTVLSSAAIITGMFGAVHHVSPQL